MNLVCRSFILQVLVSHPRPKLICTPPPKWMSESTKNVSFEKTEMPSFFKPKISSEMIEALELRVESKMITLIITERHEKRNRFDANDLPSRFASTQNCEKNYILELKCFGQPGPIKSEMTINAM